MKQLEFQYTPSVLLIPSFFILIIWMLFFIEKFFHLDLYFFGIYPREVKGLLGVLFSPFIHSNLSHIANNSIPLFLMMASMIYFYREVSLKVMVYGILLSGLITWIIGRQSYHIGASSLIYVLVSFVFFKGLQTKYFRLVSLSLTVVLVYGSMIWYIFPQENNQISWEGHLAGFVVGLFFSYYFKTNVYKPHLQFDWQKPDFDATKDPFMKHFDENGNFIELPKDEDFIADKENISDTEPKIIYHFTETKKNNKD